MESGQFFHFYFLNTTWHFVAELFKIVMKHERYVPQYISDKIIDDYITLLLSDRKYYTKQPESYKYELSVKDTYFESRLRHGIKKIPASHCKLEFEIMKETDGKLEASGILITEENRKIKVTIAGLADTYYVEIEARKLRQLLIEFLVDTITKPYACGVKIFAVMVIDRQVLLDNCITLQK